MTNDESSVALKVVVTNDDAPLSTVLHEAVLMAGRLATSVFLEHKEQRYLVHPYDNCPESCHLCVGRNPNLKTKSRDLRWNPHDSN